MADVEVFTPAPTANTLATSLTQQITPRRLPLWRRVEETWEEIQVGRQGSYSVERLESLESYCKTTSRTRVVLVCLLTPLPALTTAILVECLPLQPPSAGWAANWAFWIRLQLVQFIVGFVVQCQMIRFIPGLDITFRKMCLHASGVSTACVATCILAASTIGFPVPLMIQLFVAIPVGVYATLMTYLVLGSVLFTKGSPLKVHFDRYNRFFLAFMTFCSVLPICKVVYEAVPVKYRAVVVAVIPIWKFAAKHFILRATHELEDMKPVLVAFAVDSISAVFISTCMSTSRSLSLTILFITVDILQSGLEFREIRTNATTLLQVLNDRRNSRSQLHQGKADDLLLIIVGVTRNSGCLRRKSLEGIRLWGCLPHLLTKEKTDHLTALDTSGVYAKPSENIKSNYLQPNRRLRSLRLVSVAPVAAVLSSDPDAPSVCTNQLTTSVRRAERAKTIVVQGLQLLFHCEYLILVKYVECIVPIIYLVYNSILEHLPNVVYYPGGSGRFDLNAVATIVLLVVLEVGSLLFLNAFLQRKLAFSPLYLLAFVLKTEFYAVQAVLFAESLIVLQFELEHFGADFSLRFKWLHDKDQ